MMPYTCSVQAGVVRLEPAPETAYRVFGQRDEQIFTACGAGRQAGCTQLMVHRFMMACGGEKVSWARVAAAAKSAGKSVPHDLPAGFAPVTVLGGHFILPAIFPNSAALVTRVAMQDLSPDSVTEPTETEDRQAEMESWVPIIRAEMRPDVGGGAFRVGGTVAAVMGLLVAASMVAAGRWRVPASPLQDVPDLALSLKSFLRSRITAAKGFFGERGLRLHAGWLRRRSPKPSEALANAASMAHARLTETDRTVAGLPSDLLLRDVLSTEILQVRERLTIAERGFQYHAPEKSAAIMRALLRDLDRIARIAQSVAKAPNANADEAMSKAPRSLNEAYQVLGLNANAPVHVAKRLVDALRLNWHPDHARDESDRLRREARIKQINAAWDIVSKSPRSGANVTREAART